MWAVLRLTAVAGLLAGAVAVAMPRIEAIGLMPGAAVLVIDGQQRFVREGATTPEGVTLLRADAQGAEIEHAGRRQSLTLSRQIAASYVPAEVRDVRIVRNQRHQFLTRIAVAGREVTALVDTGASSVTFSAEQADSLRLAWREGRPVRVATASGEVDGRALQVAQLSVEGIALPDVEVIVLKGRSPPVALLGMSVLQHFDLREEGGVLHLTLRR